MGNIIHQYLDKEYETIEALMIILIISGIVGFLSYYFGETIRYTISGIFLFVGIYGYIRSYYKKRNLSQNR